MGQGRGLQSHGYAFPVLPFRRDLLGVDTGIVSGASGASKEHRDVGLALQGDRGIRIFHKSLEGVYCTTKFRKHCVQTGLRAQASCLWSQSSIQDCSLQYAKDTGSVP